MKNFLFVSLLFVLSTPIYTIDRLSEFGDLLLNVKGQSGKIALTKSATDTESKKSTTITMKSLYEKDKDGNIIGTSGSLKHSFNNFAQLDFEFSPLVNSTYQELSCRYYNFTATDIVNENTTLTAFIYIFQENGTITVGEDQEVDVKEGTVKFSVEVENWPFCLAKSECSDSTCCQKGSTYEVGSYLDFTIEMKTNDEDPSDIQEDSDTLSLGNNTQIILNSQVYADGEWIYMPEGYPLQEDSNKSYITLRFAKFNSSVLYDPVVDMSGEVTYRDTTSSSVDVEVDGNSSSFMTISFYLLALTMYILL